MRIALFATCMGDTMFPNAAKSTALLLTRLGHEVVFPPGQTCCGQMHVNTGYQSDALPLVANYADNFGDASIDAVVAPSGSCSSSALESRDASTMPATSARSARRRSDASARTASSRSRAGRGSSGWSELSNDVVITLPNARDGVKPSRTGTPAHVRRMTAAVRDGRVEPPGHPGATARTRPRGGRPTARPRGSA